MQTRSPTAKRGLYCWKGKTRKILHNDQSGVGRRTLHLLANDSELGKQIQDRKTRNLQKPRSGDIEGTVGGDPDFFRR